MWSVLVIRTCKRVETTNWYITSNSFGIALIGLRPNLSTELLEIYAALSFKLAPPTWTPRVISIRNGQMPVGTKNHHIVT